MIDLSTTYLKKPLANPLVASASTLTENIDTIRRMEDAGISAVVMHSLFEEQIRRDVHELHHRMTQGTESFAESLTYFPEPPDFVLGPEAYLEQIRKAKEAVKIPVIGSLNGYSMGGWTEYAKLIEQAGADAIELNIYFLATDKNLSSHQVEETYLEILKAVKSCVKIPVAVKIGPFFSAMANMATRLDEAGADALVLFNRFYQPDIDLENLEVLPNIVLSPATAIRLPLRWIAIIYGSVKASLAATSGIHHARDVIKALMVGADVAMLCSTLYRNGVQHAQVILHDLKEWMEKNEYESIKQMQGSMSQKSVENPASFERANYMRAITSRLAFR